MTGFTLSDVRESFIADMTRCLAQIDESTHQVDAAIAGADQLAQTAQQHADLIGVTLHAINGTTSLLSIESMLGAAHALEGLAPAAGESIRMLALHVGRLRSIAALWTEGKRAMRAMLEHELAGRSAPALAVQRTLAARIGPGLDGPALVPVAGEAAADDGWDDEPAAGPAVPMPVAVASERSAKVVIPEGIDEELVEVFREEAREVAAGLRVHLSDLEDRPDDLSTTIAASRLLHLLKGAAASVQLKTLTETATRLYVRFEDLIERAETVDPATLDQLRAGIAELAEFCDPQPEAPAFALAPTGAGPGPAEPLSRMEDEDSPEVVFREEAGRILAAALLLVDRLRAAVQGSGESRGDLVDQLEKLFHRLKGSALVVGQDGIAGTAAHAQAECERGGEGPDPDELDRAITAIRAELPRRLAAPEEPDAPTVPFPLASAPRPRPMDRELWEAFVGEAGDLLDQIDRILNTLERTSDPRAGLRSMLRHYHTLKGAANSTGLSGMGRDIHRIETHLERIVVLRVIPPLGGAVSALAEVQRRLRRGLQRAEQGLAESEGDHLERLLAGVSGVAAQSTGSWLGSNDPAWASRTDDSVHHTDSWRRGNSSRADSAAGSDLSEQDKRFIRVPVERLDGLMNMVGELVVSRSRMVSRLDNLRGMHGDGDSRRRSMIDAVETFATQSEFANLDGRRGRRAERAEQNGRSDRSDRSDRSGRPEPGNRRAQAGRIQSAAGVAGFGALELDTYEEIHVLSRRLLEAAGDVNQASTDINSELSNLIDDAEAISGIVSGLQNEITRARMVPLETLFSRLYMPVRDAAQREHKAVDLVARGEAVSIDKAIADALYGPMLHLVRNAVAHGIEGEEARRRAGKNPRGSIGVAAHQESGQIILEVSDDGAGIDLDRLREIGIANGLVSPSIAVDDPTVIELVFAPGISTSDAVGDVAGRGVGGDVVRRTVERLNGNITVSSSRGAGTMFTITLPLTTSITQAIMVRDRERVVAIPMHFTERILELDPDQLLESFERRRINIDGEILPLRSASELFGERDRGDRGEGGGVVIVCAIGDQALALRVDAVISQEEIVVKPLGAVLENHPLFSGVTLRGDGRLALILDIPGILAGMTERAPVRAPARAAKAVEAAAGAHAVMEPVAPPAPSSESDAGGPIRVLFVDDSLSVRKVAEKALASLGIEVVTAVDGQDALDQLRTGKFSIVFTDLEMPRVHGYDLIRQLRFVPAYQEVPVVVVSSRSGTKHVEHALRMGANEYLTKPFTADDLGRLISRWVRGEGKGGN